MSVQAIGWVLDHSRSESNSRLVLVSVANHADKHGRAAWPSQAAIASEANCDVRTVRRALDALHELGEVAWLELGKRVRRGRVRFLYWLPIMVEAASVPVLDAEVADRFGLATPDTVSGVCCARHRTSVLATPDIVAPDTGHPDHPYKEEPSWNRPEPSGCKSEATDFESATTVRAPARGHDGRKKNDDGKDPVALVRRLAAKRAMLS